MGGSLVFEKFLPNIESTQSIFRLKLRLKTVLSGITTLKRYC